jgi:polyhydroxyalkanoate synthesis regulator phasin
VPDNDPFRKYIDAGMVFTQLTRQRAEEIVSELIHNGELNRDQAARWVEELLERSRQSTEQLLGVVRKELDERIAQLNLVTRDDLANLASRLTGGTTRPGPGDDRAATKAAKATGAMKTAKSATTRAPAAKKTSTKASSEKKTATKASSAKKSTSATKTVAAKKATSATKSAGPSTRARKA